MNQLSLTANMLASSDNSSRRPKPKRKSRRSRAVASGTNIVDGDVETSRERSRHSRRVRRDSTNGVDISISDVKRGSKRRPTIVNSSGEGVGFRPAGPPSLSASTTKRRTEHPSVLHDTNTAARRALTSSASSIRPSNRKRLDASQVGETSYLFSERQRDKGNNNAPEYDNNDSQPVKGSDHPSLPVHDWLPSTNNNHATARVALPSRASKYRNLSAGVNKKPRARVPITKELPDRPPSRQRHAFPTHLIDANAFDSPGTTSRCRRGSGTSSRTSSARSRASPTGLFAPPEGITDRPPSRYMVKAKRNSKQGLTLDPNETSRRGVVDKSIDFPSNQAHHDPKTDGFADVDESVPPPFRIKVTTDANETALDSPDTRSTSSSFSQNLQRWPFSSQEQLMGMAVRGSNGSRGDQLSADMDTNQCQLKWFGKDDQINNAHLFETIISLPSPRPEPDVDIAIEDDLEDSDGPQTHSRNVVDNQRQPPQEPQQPGEERFPSRRAAAASKMAALKTATSVTDNSELQWIRSSTNPFFVDSSLTVDYDSMDPETAIEQTPLYSSEDLMTLAATEMTDLRLDDYTALGDASMPAPTSGMEWEDSRLLPASRSPPLRTSLGKDFLSLFAQH